MAHKHSEHGKNERGSERVKPHTPASGFGFARKKDVDDKASQEKAPRGPARPYDRKGDEQYADGVESFEEEGGSQPRDDGKDEFPTGRKGHH